ncbi:hypothetical protein TSOC_001983 [Tetrabaena socialis]|uniref:Uncharacterized protein n=1 Tax=Tetrabaena socialis TaxID=47790 RepID=A0A2J8AF99_9CHLO|nr:hypothetical protein TSOC_001983 [Tetrabaena socialis]|eukprot:PNH11197.1 hypothetical protein TSOC_001983 [Tetrabaena socialis]
MGRPWCYDLGTYGWLLNCLGPATKSTKFFVFVNSSVRGPFIPPYVGASHWTTMLTQYLRGSTKLVGATISCEVMPHVQSYTFATDSLGMKILLAGGALDCHLDHMAAISNGELRLSDLMFTSNYTIASLMADQRGVRDWAVGAPAYCATHPENPTVEGRAYRDLHPFEVLFVKVKNDVDSRGVTYSGQKEALFFSNN